MSAIVRASPASSTVFPAAFAGLSIARTTIFPMSRTATSCWRGRPRLRLGGAPPPDPGGGRGAGFVGEPPPAAGGPGVLEPTVLPRVPRQPSHAIPVLPQGPRQGPPLLPRPPRHEDCLRLRHRLDPPRHRCPRSS